MSNIHQMPGVGTSDREPPKRILRPCDYGLKRVINDLETQVGTVEAYNKLCDAAEALKAKIDAGKAQPQNPLFATNPDWIYPIDHAPKRPAK